MEGRGVEDAVKCVKIFDGAETCSVTFQPCYMFSDNNFMAQFENGQMPMVQVLELYQNSENTFKRWKAHRNHAMAS